MVLTRLAKEEDAAKFAEFITRNQDRNHFDADIVKYPSLRTLAVDVDGEAKYFLPFHPVFVLESVASAPGITAEEYIKATDSALSTVEAISEKYGIAENWFMCADESVERVANRRGYEVVTMKVLRKKLEK